MAYSMAQWCGKVAVVTGASSGIGAAISEALVNEGVKVVGVARRVEKVEELAKKLAGKKGTLHSVKADLTNEQDIVNAFKWTTANIGPVHILINNAGTVAQTSLISGDTALWKRTLDTNVLALCIATREAVQIMKSGKIAGHIVNIASIAGHYMPDIPDNNVYAASKAAVLMLTKTLKYDLRREKCKIKVSSLCPGLVKTELLKDLPSLGAAPTLNAEDLAQAILYILSCPPHVEVNDLIVRPLGEMIP